MRELYVDTKKTVDEAGNCHEFIYSVLIGQMNAGRHFGCEAYGVKVSEVGGATAKVPNITISAHRIDALLGLLLEHTVSPAGLEDVISDWL